MDKYQTLENGKSVLKVFPDGGYTVFCVWAEENSDLATNDFEWAFGNGSNTPLASGIVVPIDCDLFAMGLNVEGGSATVRVIVDSNTSLSTYQVAASAPSGSTTFTTPLAITAGQVINFRTVASSGADTNQGRVVAWFRVRSTPASTSITNDLLDVSISGINSGELMRWNGTSFVPYDIQSELNLRDVNNRNRANHTNTQLSSTISDFTARVKTDETTTSIAIVDRTISYTDEDAGVTPIVIPFADHQSISKISDAVGSIGINNSTTLTTWLELNISVPIAGSYDLDWSYIWSYNAGARDFIGNVRLDGGVIVEHVQEPKDAAGTGVTLSRVGGGTQNTGTNQRHAYSGFFPNQSLSAGSHTLLIEWASSQSNDRAAIYRGSLRAKRIS